MRLTLTDRPAEHEERGGGARPLAFAGAVLAVGIVRFGLTLSGVGDSTTRYASMTAVIAAAVLYLGLKPMSPRRRLLVSYILIAPYMLVEVVGLGYTWSTGTETIFHAEPYTLGTPIHVHFWGHVIGGLTWEPLIVFVLLTVVGALGRRVRGQNPVRMVW